MSQLLRAGLVSGFVCAVFLIVLGKAELVAQEIDLPWVRVEAGTFQMGCVPDDPFCLDTEQPRHEVTLSAFELMETELTVSQYGIYTVSYTHLRAHETEADRVCRLLL